MDDIKITNMNEVDEPSRPNLLDDFIDATDEDINTLGRGPLRVLATKILDEHYLRRDLAVLPFDDETLIRVGGLSELESTIGILRERYAEHDPVALRRYDAVQVRIFNTDQALRDQLIRTRDAQRTLRDQA